MAAAAAASAAVGATDVWLTWRRKMPPLRQNGKHRGCGGLGEGVDGSGKSSIGESFSRARQSRFGSTKKGEEWKERRRCDSADEKLLSLLSFLMQVLI